MTFLFLKHLLFYKPYISLPQNNSFIWLDKAGDWLEGLRNAGSNATWSLRWASENAQQGDWLNNKCPSAFDNYFEWFKVWNFRGGGCSYKKPSIVIIQYFKSFLRNADKSSILLVICLYTSICTKYKLCLLVD